MHAMYLLTEMSFLMDTSVVLQRGREIEWLNCNEFSWQKFEIRIC